MTVQIIHKIKCDGVGCKRVELFKPKEMSYEARRRLRKTGWTTDLKRDYCKRCSLIKRKGTPNSEKDI